MIINLLVIRIATRRFVSDSIIIYTQIYDTYPILSALLLRNLYEIVTEGKMADETIRLL
jgi:hypothetical protein